MALNDILGRINQDAQNQAQSLVSEAESQAAALVADFKKGLNRKAKLAEEKRSAVLENYVSQQAQIMNFTSDQKLLTAQREALRELVQTVLAKVLAEQDLRQSAYAYAFKHLPQDVESIAVAAEDLAMVTQLAQELKPQAKVTTTAGEPGVCLAYQGKALIDCSIPVLIMDIAGQSEGRLAEVLFSV